MVESNNISFSSAAEAFSTPLTTALKQAALAITPRRWVPFAHVNQERREQSRRWYTRERAVEFKRTAIECCISDWAESIGSENLRSRLKSYNIHHSHSRMFPHDSMWNMNISENLVLIDRRFHGLIHTEIDRIVAQAFSNQRLPETYDQWYRNLKPSDDLAKIPEVMVISRYEMYISIPFPAGPYCIPQLMLYEHQCGLPSRAVSGPRLSSPTDRLAA